MDEDNQKDTSKSDNNQAAPDALDAVKQRALKELVPVLDDLKGLEPERKFDICIAAMRYTDNKLLAETALDAALAIEEKGTKAEALVELVNEINYLQSL